MKTKFVNYNVLLSLGKVPVSADLKLRNQWRPRCPRSARAEWKRWGQGGPRTVRVGLAVGDCPGFKSGSVVYTGYHSVARIIIEEVLKSK